MSAKSFSELGPDMQQVIHNALSLKEELLKRKPAPKPKPPVDEEKEERREIEREVKYALQTIEQAMVKNRIIAITDLPFSYEMKLEEKKNTAAMSSSVVRTAIKAVLDELGINLDVEVFMAMIQTVRAHNYQAKRTKPKYRFTCKKAGGKDCDGGIDYTTVQDPDAMRRQIIEAARSQLNKPRAHTPGPARARAVGT
jgi:hypothetical protein